MEERCLFIIIIEQKGRWKKSNYKIIDSKGRKSDIMILTEKEKVI